MPVCCVLCEVCFLLTIGIRLSASSDKKERRDALSAALPEMTPAPDSSIYSTSEVQDDELGAWSQPTMAETL